MQYALPALLSISIIFNVSIYFWCFICLPKIVHFTFHLEILIVIFFFNIIKMLITFNSFVTYFIIYSLNHIFVNRNLHIMIKYIQITSHLLTSVQVLNDPINISSQTSKKHNNKLPNWKAINWYESIINDRN